jgi:uncharacterized RDD family membrane protein YckC
MSQPKPASWSPESEQDWKQEVNRRLAEHKYRRGIAAVAPLAPAPPSHPSNGSRAAQAAARVAARYSKAPSYSEMQAAEARTVVRAAEIATQVALEAQAAAEAVLANLDAATTAPNARDKKPPRAVRPPEPFLNSEPFLKLEDVPTAPPESTPTLSLESKPAKKSQSAKKNAGENQAIGILWEPDMPVRATETPVTYAQHENPRFEIPVEDWWEAAPPMDEAEAVLEPVEPAQPIFANLIEFPSELVATRKVRPRLAESPSAAGPVNGQLSIFEVEPGAISIEPEVPVAPEAPAGPEWSGMELEAQPTPQVEAEPARKAPGIELACLSRRLMATVVDGSLIMGTFLAIAVEIASHAAHLPTLRVAKEFAGAGLFATAVVYLAIFSTLTASTPGMKYAGISLCTFSDEFPTCLQRCQRLGALLLSLLPMGLGIVWGLFDEEHLSWHDRLSQTYQRKC